MILVSGGTGLVGSHLLFLLTEKGYPVRAIYRNRKNISETERIFRFYKEDAQQQLDLIEWVEADVTDYYALVDALQGVKHVYHAAARVSFNPGESELMLQVNTEGTANLMNACLQVGIEKVCYVSSVSSLGKNLESNIIDENVEWQPDDYRSAYSYSKFRAEMEVWRASKEGLPVVIVNPSVVIGPVNWKRSSGRLFYSVKKGMPFYTNGGAGFVDVRDVARAAVMLMESDVVNERYILNSENLTYKEFFTIVAKALGKRPPFIRASKWITELGWRINLVLCAIAGKAPAITKDTARTAHSVSYYSAKKFSTQFNYKFLPISEAVENASRWFKKQ